jgi:transcriptional regulator with XRE-family HTH domain
MTDGGDNPPTYWGFDNPGASINFKILKEIIADMKTGKLTREQLADKYKISSNTIKRIASGQTFRLEDETYPIRSTLLEQETVEEIKWYLYNTDIPGTELGFKFGLNRGNIKDINIGKSHKVGNTYPIRQRYISRNTYLNILMALEEGFSVKEIAKQTKASRAAILKIQANRNYYYNY